MSTIVITGLPGSGKTRLALALAARLAAEREVRLLPTDAVKAVLRTMGLVKGPGWREPAEKARLLRPYLADQAAEAAAEGFVLVVEGTLAAGFRPPGACVVRLEVEEGERARRVGAKPAAARAALAEAGDLRTYRTWLASQADPGDLVLDGGRPIEALVAAIVAATTPAG